MSEVFVSARLLMDDVLNKMRIVSVPSPEDMRVWARSVYEIDSYNAHMSREYKRMLEEIDDLKRQLREAGFSSDNSPCLSPHKETKP